MRITKNNVGIEIQLEEFLDVLESGLFDDMLLFIMGLDEGMGEYIVRSVDEDEFLEDIDDDEMVDEFQIGYIFEGPMPSHEMNNYISLIEEAIEKAHEAIMKDFDGEYEMLEIDTSQPIDYKRPRSSYARSREDSKVRTLLTKYKGM